jgi:hypothetical protein
MARILTKVNMKTNADVTHYAIAHKLICPVTVVIVLQILYGPTTVFLQSPLHLNAIISQTLHDQIFVRTFRNHELS